MFLACCLSLQTWHTQSLTEMCLLFPYLCRANSVTWNPHKMMGVPLQCSAILVRERVSLCHPLFHRWRYYDQWSWTQHSFLLFIPHLHCSHCRDFYKAATLCVRATCSSQTSSTMSHMTRGTRPFSADAMLISLSFGSCGRQRWAIIWFSSLPDSNIWKNWR